MSAWPVSGALVLAALAEPAVADPSPPPVALPFAPRVAQAPAPGILPANASRVTAQVLDRKTWSPEALRALRPAVRPDVTLYSFTIAVRSSAPARADLPSAAPVGATLEVFSTTPLPGDVVGHVISATVEERGDTRASRWWISDITRAN